MKELRVHKKGKYYPCFVDDEDYDGISHYSWQLNERGYAVVCMVIDGKRRQIRMHRFVLNAPEDLIVDHINFNQLDNQKENLRLCTREENARHTRPSQKSLSSYKGVFSSSGTTDKDWSARITKNGRRLFLGNYRTEEGAARAYDEQARLLFGDFAYVNFEYANEDKREALSPMPLTISRCS